MAESKKTSGSKSKAQSNAELAEQLRLAAEILAGASEKPAEEAPEATKPAAKKPAAKKPAAKSGTSKAPAKKPTTKKPTTKAQPKKAEAPADEVEEKPVAEEKPAEPVAEQPAEQPAESQPQKRFGNRRSDCINCGAENNKDAVVCHVCGEKLRPLPNAEPQAQPEPVAEEPKAEQPVAEEPKAEEKAPEQPVAEEKAEEPAKEEPAQPAAQPAQPAAQPKKSNAFMDKSSNFINNKGKLPLWIVANSLLLLSSIFLIIGAFSISYNILGVTGTIECSVFQYFGNAATIKEIWQGTAGAWANGGYVMVGILMFFSFLVPLALIAKNIVFFVLKKNKDVHMLDAIVSFAFLIAYLGVVNMYGANMTWAHVLALIMSIILLAYTIFVILVENREGAFPFFSIANLVMVMLCMFLLTSNKIYAAKGWYAAAAAAYSGGGGFAFIMLLIGLAALVLLLVMQVKKLPGKIAWLFEFLVPAVAGVCAFIALVSFAGGKPDGLSMGGGFVFGAILTLLFAAADVVFALVPKLHKFNVKVTDRMSGSKPVPATTPVQQPATAAPEQPAQQPAAEQPAPEQPAEQPAAEQPAPTGDKVYCPSCGMQNGAEDMFCMKCGRKLK